MPLRTVKANSSQWHSYYIYCIDFNPKQKKNGTFALM